MLLRKPWFISLTALAVSIVFLSSCSRERREDDETAVAEEGERPVRFVDTFLPDPIEFESLTLPVRYSPQVRILGEDETDLVIRTISDLPPRGLRVGIANTRTRGSAMLSLGDTFQGHRLVGTDAPRDIGIFLHDGRLVGVKLRVDPPEDI